VVIASDGLFYRGLLCTVLSIAIHEKTHPLRIHILDGGLNQNEWISLEEKLLLCNKQCDLIRHSFNKEMCSGLAEISEYGLMTYARILIPQLVEAARAIYVDSDFIITRQISDSLQYFDEGVALSGTAQSGNLSQDCPWSDEGGLKKYPYVNAGFLLMNLGKWREDGITDRMFRFLRKESRRCRYADQSAMNWLLKDEMALLPREWNTFANQVDDLEVAALPGRINIHYASGLKPWKRPIPTLSHGVWWEFAKRVMEKTDLNRKLLIPENLIRYLRYCTPGRVRHLKRQLPGWKSYWKSVVPPDLRTA